MNSSCHRFVVVAFVGMLCASAGLCVSGADGQPPERDVEAAIRQYFTAMAKRDATAIRAAVDERFVAIEAGHDARAEFANLKKLLPPEGNKDWDDTKIADMRIQISPTHPSVATAAFTVVFPLGDDRLSMMRELLQNHATQFGDTERREIQKQIDNKCVNNSMFAVLGKRNGKWKIVCMTFPK